MHGDERSGTVVYGGTGMEAITSITQGVSSQARWAAEAAMLSPQNLAFTQPATALHLVALSPVMAAPVADGRGVGLDSYA